MNSYRPRSSIGIFALLTSISLGGLPAFAQNDETVPPPAPAQELPEVLSRGPVHEAFAEPVTLQTQESFVVPKPPPAPISEVPPAERPQGNQFIWIPGYWSWDADRLDYIWVSACWRAAPPNMSWVPGYWAQVPGGWKWVPGFWSPTGVQDLVYLPEPPAIEDIEPVSIQPFPDAIWVPPCMYWSNGRYIRRAGYWLTAQPNWVWVPSHYILTPRGYVFAEGHWDYSLDRRGVLFAPVYIPSAVYLRAGFTFSPGIVVDLGLLRVSLFTYPRYSHYFFGDYYDNVYLSIGIFPWFESRRYHTWYDPIYEHDRWQHHRVEPRWEEHERDEYLRRCNNRDLRPAHTFREQEIRLTRMPESQRRSSQLTRSLEVSVSTKNASIKFEKINSDTRQSISKQTTAVGTYRDERSRWENTVPDRRIQPVETHKSTPAQPVKYKSDVQPTEDPVVKTVTPYTDHKKRVQPVDEHKPSVTQPAERSQTIQPVKKTERTTSPAPQQNPEYNTTRETRPSRPEQVQIPASPVTGNNGKSGFFRKGPPKYPDYEEDTKTDHR